MLYSHWTCFSDFANSCNCSWAQLGAVQSHPVVLCMQLYWVVFKSMWILFRLRKHEHKYLEVTTAPAWSTQLIFSLVLKGGEHFAINYTALLDTREVWDGRVLTLPAKLTFRSSSQVFSVQFCFAIYNYCQNQRSLKDGSCVSKPWGLHEMKFLDCLLWIYKYMIQSFQLRKP